MSNQNKMADMIEQMLDSMNSDLAAELSMCETTSFNGHEVVLASVRYPGDPGRRGVIYVDKFECSHDEAVSVLSVPVPVEERSAADPEGTHSTDAVSLHDQLCTELGMRIESTDSELMDALVARRVKSAKDLRKAFASKETR